MSAIQKTARDPARVCMMLGFAYLLKNLAAELANIPLKHFLQTDLGGMLRGLNWTAFLLNAIPIYCVGLPVLLLCLRFIPDGAVQPTPEKNPNPLLYILLAFVLAEGVGFLVSLPTNFLIDAVNGLLGHQSTNAVSTAMADQALWSNFLFGAVVAGFGEEFLYRHLLYKKMRGCSELSYMLMSGLLFGLMHASFYQILYAFGIGVIFAWVYLRTRSYLVVAVAHTLVDTIGLVFSVGGAQHPWMTAVTLAVTILGTLASIVLLVLFARRVWKGLRPATEPGWGGRSTGEEGEALDAKKRSTAAVMLLNPGMLLFIAYCLGTAVYSFW